MAIFGIGRVASAFTLFLVNHSNKPRKQWSHCFCFLKKTHAPVVTRWFGARCFGVLISPYERDCYLRVPLESQTTNSNHQLTISWFLVLWMVNQPPLTYPPRNKALIRAHEPLVSLNRVLLNHELKSIKIRFPLKVPPIRTREHPRTLDVAVEVGPFAWLVLAKGWTQPSVSWRIPNTCWWVDSTIASLPERNLKMDYSPFKRTFHLPTIDFQVFC